MDEPFTLPPRRLPVADMSVPEDSEAETTSLRRILDASAVSLAREIARDMHPLETILRNHGYDGTSDPRWKALRDHPDFINLLAQCIQEWNSADSTQKRVEIKAQTAIEVLIPVLATRATDRSTSAAGLAELTKVLITLSNMRQQATASGPAFSITINMGNGQSMVVRDTAEGRGETIVDTSADADATE